MPDVSNQNSYMNGGMGSAYTPYNPMSTPYNMMGFYNPYGYLGTGNGMNPSAWNPLYYGMGGGGMYGPQTAMGGFQGGLNGLLGPYIQSILGGGGLYDQGRTNAATRSVNQQPMQGYYGGQAAPPASVSGAAGLDPTTGTVGTPAAAPGGTYNNPYAAINSQYRSQSYMPNYRQNAALQRRGLSPGPNAAPNYVAQGLPVGI